jgi:hypothetical protein
MCFLVRSRCQTGWGNFCVACRYYWASVWERPTDVWMKVGGIMQMVVERNRLRAQMERGQRNGRRYHWRKEQKQTKKHKKITKIEQPYELKKKNWGKRQINVYILSVTFIISCREVCVEIDITHICAIDMQYISSSSYPSIFWLAGSFPSGIIVRSSSYCCITVSSCVSDDFLYMYLLPTNFSS